MANASVHIHLHPDDAPYVERLSSGTVAVWVQGRHLGPAVSGSPKSLAALRDALDAYLAQAAKAEAA